MKFSEQINKRQEELEKQKQKEQKKLNDEKEERDRKWKEEEPKRINREWEEVKQQILKAVEEGKKEIVMSSDRHWQCIKTCYFAEIVKILKKEGMRISEVRKSKSENREFDGGYDNDGIPTQRGTGTYYDVFELTIYLK